MPDTTANYGFRIPKADGTDLIQPDDIRVPITSIDTIIDSIDDRLDKYDTNPTEQVTSTSALAIAANWTLSYCSIERRGKVACFSAQVVRTTATIPGNSNGNIGNITIGTVTAGWRPTKEVGISPRATGPIWGGYINSAGVFAVCSLVPNWTLPIGETLTCSATYLLP